MFSWRRRAKAERENVMSADRLFDLVNQTLLGNIGPLGSYAITRRDARDSDDIFHTMLASSVAHNIVSSLIEHGAVVISNAPLEAVPKPTPPKPAPPKPASLAPFEAVPVPTDLAEAVTEISLSRADELTAAAVRAETGLEPQSHADRAAIEVALTERAGADGVSAQKRADQDSNLNLAG